MFLSNSEAPRQYGDWLRANGSPKLGSEKARKFNSNGVEERKDEDSGEHQTPSTSIPTDMEADRVGPSASPVFSNSKILNLNQRQDGTSAVQSTEKSGKTDKVTIRFAQFVKELGIFGLVVTTGEDFAWYLGYILHHLIMTGGHLDIIYNGDGDISTL
nr:hypothetical protein CFP56_29177 [Quercus suber]